MSRRIVSPASIAGRSEGIAATCLVNESSCRRRTSYAVAAMKSPIVSKCRNKAPTDTPARLVITAADARAYPTSMIVAMLASGRRPPPRRGELASARARPQVAAGLHRLPVAVAEFAVAEHDCAVHTRCHD